MIAHLKVRTYSAHVGDDGLAFVNEYSPDESGTIRRETIIDGINNEDNAWEIVRALERAVQLAKNHTDD